MIAPEGIEIMTQDNSQKILIGIPLYKNFDALDVVGPHQTFFMQDPQLTTLLVGPTKHDPVESYEHLRILPDCSFDSCPQLDVLFVPGGVRFDDTLCDQTYIGFLQRQAKKAKLITSVCTGALLLAAAGLLDGYKATIHWGYKSVLKLFPHVIVADGYPRFIIDANRITGGGISSGLDEAMAIVSILMGNDAAKRGQLIMQYAPQPIFNSGDPSTAEPSILYEVSTDLRGSVESLSRKVEQVLTGTCPKPKGKGAGK